MRVAEYDRVHPAHTTAPATVSCSPLQVASAQEALKQADARVKSLGERLKTAVAQVGGAAVRG